MAWRAFRLILALGLTMSAPARADWWGTDFPVPTGAQDLGGRYDSLMVDGALDPGRVEAAFAPVRTRLAGMRVVIVPSYLVDILLPGREMGLIDYFSDQQLWLESLGAETLLAPIDTEAAVADNGRALAAFLSSDDRPTCIISHSKGGVDTLDALIRMNPAALEGIACWIALQAPFAGSPIADLVADWDDARPTIDEVLTSLGGSGRSLDDLTVEERRTHLRRADGAIRDIACQVPILAVATTMRPPESWIPQSRFEPGRLWMAAHGILSDGVVPTNSSILPYAPYVVIRGLNHTDTIDGDRPFGPPVLNDVLFLKAILAIALRAPACPV